MKLTFASRYSQMTFFHKQIMHKEILHELTIFFHLSLLKLSLLMKQQMQITKSEL